MRRLLPMPLFLALSLGLPLPASAHDDTSLYQESPTVGTTIPRKVVIGGVLPIHQRYAELSEDHRKLLRNRYNNMPERDEPPYPAEGLAAIYKPVSQIQSKFLGRGTIEMYVTVGADGKPRSVEVYRTPDPAISQELAAVLMLIEFKPALCGGRPCTMEFPLDLELTVRR